MPGDAEPRQHRARIQFHRRRCVASIQRCPHIADICRELRDDPIRARSQPVGTENFTKPRHFRANGHCVEFALVEQDRKVVGAETLRVFGKQKENLA